MVAEKEPEGVDVVHDERKGRGQECQAHDLHAGNRSRLQGAHCGDAEDEELELNDPPLILPLMKASVWVGDYVGGALQNVFEDSFSRRVPYFARPARRVADACGPLLKQRCDK